MSKRTQKTPKGYEIPVPERDELHSAFERIAGPLRGQNQDRKAKEGDASRGRFKKQRGRAKP